MSTHTEETPNPPEDTSNETTEKHMSPEMEALQNRKTKARSEKIDQVIQKQLNMQILMAKRGTTVISRSDSLGRPNSGSNAR